MKNRASCLRRHFRSVVCAGVGVLVCGAFQSTVAATQASPVLISTAGSTRALAVESVSMRSEPFTLSSEGDFSPNDARTRIEVFCTNLDLLAGEGANALTADAQDAAGNRYDLKVEFVGQVPQSFDLQGNMLGDFRGISMAILRLNDLMPANLGDVLIRLNLHGMSSNRVRVAIGQSGGGPADDAGAVPTPLAGSLPAVQSPLTIAQYQAQYNSPAFPSDADIQRFLEQSSWGLRGDGTDVAHVRQIGMAAFINEQFNTPPLFVDNSSNPTLFSDYPAMPLYPQFYPGVPATPCDSSTTCFRDNYTLYQLQKQFVNNAVTQPDQLRQRVAFGLHKIIVIAGRDMNNNQASWYAPYLQTIDRNAFGNYRQLLLDITLNPGMGNYLNVSANSRVAPNENYARELMQLFSIGTDLLNPDGTPILDANGNRIPTYGQTEITNFARVFTGWIIPTTQVSVGGVSNINTPDYIHPMSFQNNLGANGPFDIAAKTLLNGQSLPACGNCTNNAANMAAYKNAELNAAIDNLFNHQNTGPFVCAQLIHQLVTSNPSPAYVGRCAAAFANNGSGVRGDMKAIVTAILLDPEARGDVKTNPNYGRLREPVQLMWNLLRSFNATTDGVLVTNVSGAGSFSTLMGQDVFNPPTVFSYFPADYALPGTSLIGPEFGILDTSTAYQRANFVNTLFLNNAGNGIAANSPNRPTGTQTNYSTYQAMAASCTGVATCQLVDALNANMMHGTMSSSMRTSIVNAVTGIASGDPAGRTRTAIYLVSTSSQFQVQR